MKQTYTYDDVLAIYEEIEADKDFRKPNRNMSCLEIVIRALDPEDDTFYTFDLQSDGTYILTGYINKDNYPLDIDDLNALEVTEGDYPLGLYDLPY